MSLYDVNQKPIPDIEDKKNLSEQIQNTVELKVNTAMDAEKRNFEAELKLSEAKRISDRNRQWGVIIGLAILWAAVTFTAWFVQPDTIKEMERVVVSKLNEKLMVEIIGREITNKASAYVQQQLTKELIPINERLADSRAAILLITNHLKTIREEQERYTADMQSGLNRVELKLGVLTNNLDQFALVYSDAYAFLSTAANAQAMDFKAYMRLHEYASTTNDYSQQAARIENQIKRQLEENRRSKYDHSVYIDYIAGEGYGGPFIMEELDDAITTFPQHIGAFAYCAYESHFYGLIRTLGDSLKNTDDLVAADDAIKYIGMLTTNTFNAGDIPSFERWWDGNSNNYKRLEYRHAKTVQIDGKKMVKESLEDVLHNLLIDDGADRSRSSVISMLVRDKQTSNAVELAKGFKNPNSRWSILGRTLANSSTNSQTVATSNIVAIAKQIPYIKGYLIANPAYLDNVIDWAEYDKQMGVVKK